MLCEVRARGTKILKHGTPPILSLCFLGVRCLSSASSGGSTQPLNNASPIQQRVAFPSSPLSGLAEKLMKKILDGRSCELSPPARGLPPAALREP